MPASTLHFDAIVIGAGAAGLLCAETAAKGGLTVALLESSDRAGKKIRISGGGRCNFTNIRTTSEHFLCANPHFVKSALSRFSPYDFIERLETGGLSWHEKHLGQLFCDQKADAVADLLLQQACQQGTQFFNNAAVTAIEYDPDNQRYDVLTEQQRFTATNCIVATGGPSIPKLGSSTIALSFAKTFHLKNSPFAPALVPLKLAPDALQSYDGFSGLSFKAEVSCAAAYFHEDILFTHRGLSGPGILQISSYLEKNEALFIDFLPQQPLADLIQAHAKRTFSNILLIHLPRKLALLLAQPFSDRPLSEWSKKDQLAAEQHIHKHRIQPSGNEGMKKAEVAKGGIDTSELSSKTLECKKQPGLYFIGEAVDVIGHLGGYNFQWAWASGYAAGGALIDQSEK